MRLLLRSQVAKHLAISEVARVFGLRTSAIRYYEQIGILPPPLRKNGQRCYDKSVLYRLAVVQRAREMGFTLDEIRELFFGFEPGTSPPKRWHQLSKRKNRGAAEPHEAAQNDGDAAQANGEMPLRRAGGMW